MATATETEIEEEVEAPTSTPRWTMLEGAGAHIVGGKKKTGSGVALCGAKGKILVRVGTIPPERRAPCQECAAKN